MIKTNIYIQNSANNCNQNDDIPLLLTLNHQENGTGGDDDDDDYHPCLLQEYISTSHYQILFQNAWDTLDSSYCIEVYNRCARSIDRGGTCKDDGGVVHDITSTSGDKEKNEQKKPPRPARAPVIYVHQREMAHASSRQYDNMGAILASDSATTCHIVAFRSVCVDDNNNTLRKTNDEKKNGKNDELSFLATLCHFDSTDNLFPCLKHIIQHHVKYHECEDDNDDFAASSPTRICQMDIHMIGGYDDDQNTSSTLTHCLISSLAKLATQYKEILKLNLRTCIVGEFNTRYGIKESSRMDDNGGFFHEYFTSPIVRGLVMDVLSGKIHVLLQHVDRSLVGPEPILRHARLWSSTSSSSSSDIASEVKDMMVVHDYDKEQIILRPFTFHAFHGIEKLLSLPDCLLLEYTSTSPDCEADNFCDGIRKVCRYLMQTRVEDVFGLQDCT
eukprot:CAMPEP_0176481442 /NCGR_PEP_ID=MMETSP0200_2-20121128/2821_1 /TAXON_ID=947934 /ORGANISM="Chaetoceros sp., Strain GSL56" /LENGTH=443 /DNA_ID=CAMNT_0017877645 /DNA_START=28 /DNA_END=1355 /DNA_ORIENTATION=-